MECRHLDIKVVSAEDLKDVNLFSKMDVYAVVSISGDAYSKQKTSVHKDCGKNPTWNHQMRFTINESVVRQNPNLAIRFSLKSSRPLGDRDIGEVYVPVKELLDKGGDREQMVHYSVRRRNGKSKGRLTFSYKFGEKFTVQSAPPPNTAPFKSNNGKAEPVIAYPPSQYYNHAPAGGSSSVYPPPSSQPAVGYPYPPPPPPPSGHGGYPGYPPHGAGGYHQYPPPPVARPQKPRKGGMGMGMGMGLGAGLLGGLLVGEMVDDVADYGDFDCDFDF